MRLFILTILLFSSISYADSITEYCRMVPSEDDTLYGELQIRTFAGPPNYESIENGDQAETVKVLVLNHPTCMMFPDKDYEKTYIEVVQLIDLNSRLNKISTKKLMLKGKLFIAETGHHHTRVLIDIKEAEDAL